MGERIRRIPLRGIPVGARVAVGSTNDVAPPRALRDLAELLHLPAVGFVIVAAFLFVRVADGGRTPGGTLAIDGGQTDASTLVTFLLAVLLTQLSIALHNDWCDRDADALAKPWRWIPRGVLSARAALVVAVLLLASGVTLAALLGPLVAALVLLGTLCGWTYNAWLKRTAWSWVPFAVALPTLAVCSLAVAGRLDGIPYALYLLGAPLVLAIHLADSAPDIDGDRTTGSRGLAVALGQRRALIACWSGAAAAIVLASLLRPFGLPPGPLVAVSVALLVGAVLVSARSLQAHRYLILASAVAVAVDYVAALAG